MRLINAEGIRVKPEFMHNVCGMAMIRVEDIVRILNEQPTIVQEPHWIPCSERLPEEDGLYLVTTSKGQVQVHVFSHNGNSEEYWMRCNKAWIPLPEPYQEGADE
ncbi:MAG: DUF551 domain-containing protein [Lachnospiraceae bacterium]|nr:DUF551 domain-containing protein [Lachnospiraceae bacterium]